MSDAIGENTIQAAAEAITECLREKLSDLNRVFLESDDAMKVGVKLTFGSGPEGNMQVDAKLSLNLGKATAEARKWARED